MTSQFINLWKKIWRAPSQVGEMALHLTSTRDVLLNPMIYGFSLALHILQSFDLMNIPYRESFPALFSSKPALFCFLLVSGGMLGHILARVYAFALYMALSLSSRSAQFSQVQGLVVWTMAPTLLTFFSWNVALWMKGPEILSWKWQLSLFLPLEGMQFLVFFLGLIYMTILCVSILFSGVLALTLGNKKQMAWTLCLFLIFLSPLSLFFPLVKVVSLFI